MNKKLLVPDIGDFENVEVIELLVKEGDKINENEPVATIESDKSSVEIPSIFSGTIEKIEIKVGDKVSKGDLLLTINSTDQKISKQNNVPKNTENLIQEAEKAILKENKITDKSQIKKDEKNYYEEQKNNVIQVINEGDNDPLETQDWLDSLSAVIQKQGNQRAHYLIRELINKAYMEGANIPYTQNTPYINYNTS